VNILILGGTGFIGPHVVRHLAASGHAVTLYNRGQSTTQLPAGITQIIGDRAAIGEAASRFRALRPDVVLDMRALVESDARRVVDTMTGIAPRLVTISSIDVYRAFARFIGTEPGEPDAFPFDENGPLRNKRFPYRDRVDPPPPASDPRAWAHDYDKIPIEELVLGTSGIAGTILRLPMVYGDDDYQHRLLPYVQRFADQRPVIVLGEQQAAFRATRGYVGNVVAVIALAVTDDRACGRTFNVGDETAFTERQWVRFVGDAGGWQGRIGIVPDTDLPVSLSGGGNFQHHSFADTGAIRRDLDFKDPFDLATSLERTIAWERKHLAPEPVDYTAEDAVLAQLN